MPHSPRTDGRGFQRWIIGHRINRVDGPDQVDCFFGSAVMDWRGQRVVVIGNTERLSFQLYQNGEYSAAYFPP